MTQMSKNPWFEVDKEGLSKLMERKGGKQFVVFELIQNAWDENSHEVVVEFRMLDNKRQAFISVVDDNPEGFVNLSHAFTLFAESSKKSDPTKRGRFNLGEKLVLACCVSASVATTTGTIVFEGNSRRHERAKRAFGSCFSGCIKMTKAEYEEIYQNIWTLIPPAHIRTICNGTELAHRKPVSTFQAALSTEISDTEGVLRRTVRNTEISLYEPIEGETASIYELGIPVVETGDKYHIDVGQKVPLTMDRENVPPSYLRDLRTHVLNATYDLLQEDDSTSSWVRDASADEDVLPKAVQKVLTMRFGDKAVAYDPSDSEANRIAVSQGYTVVPGRSMSVGEWVNARKIGFAPPSGQVTPSPKPFSPNGEPLNLISPDKWTLSMKSLVSRFKYWAKAIDVPLHTVNITDDIGWKFFGCYGDGQLCINRARLGSEFFDDYPGNLQKVLEFFIHEMGHYYGSHLSDEYYDGLCTIGAKLVVITVKDLSQ
ncbi:MAG: hypothetical protein WC375_00335 [Methanomassiliicoccales archaeon]|jgi:hypothetical protein